MLSDKPSRPFIIENYPLGNRPKKIHYYDNMSIYSETFVGETFVGETFVGETFVGETFVEKKLKKTFIKKIKYYNLDGTILDKPSQDFYLSYFQK